MARKKSGSEKSKQSSRSALGGRLSWFRWRAVVALSVVAILGWGGQAIWHSVAPMVIHRDNYLVPAEGFSISQTPEWITADVCAEVVRNSGIDRRLSVLEEDFVRAVQDAFALHPWVESVDRIQRSYPPAVHVEVTYRRPVAVVELPSSDGVDLYPVDRHAIRLPERDVPEIRKRYLPRIGGIVERPPLGQRWEDPRVLGATVLAEHLADRWEALSLVDILPSPRLEIHAEHRYFVYDLITRGGTRIGWGAAPNQAPPDEDPFAAKLHRLQTYVQQYGPLDTVRGPKIVDVRRGLKIVPRSAKKTERDEEPAVVK